MTNTTTTAAAADVRDTAFRLLDALTALAAAPDTDPETAATAEAYRVTVRGLGVWAADRA